LPRTASGIFDKRDPPEVVKSPLRTDRLEKLGIFNKLLANKNSEVSPSMPVVKNCLYSRPLRTMGDTIKNTYKQLSREPYISGF
jgi:hypothetical protein